MSNYNHATCNVLRSELTYHSKEINVKFAPLKKPKFCHQNRHVVPLGSYLLLKNVWFIFTVHQNYLSEYKFNSAYSEPTGVNCTATDCL